MSEQLNVVLSDPINDRLKQVSEETGLNKSEIARRGILEQTQKLTEG